MSWEAVTWAVAVGEERSLEPIKRHILLILANRADEAGYLYPSISWISQRTGYDRRTVQRQCTSMQKSGLFTRVPRTGQGGDRTSDAWQLAMQQPGLQLGGDPVQKPVDNLSTDRRPPRGSVPPPRVTHDTPPAAGRRPPGGSVPPDSKDQTKDDSTTRRGGVPPSPVAVAFKAYQDGIRARYRAEYPPSAKANGQLANVVGRVGKAMVADVVRHYLAHPDPFYGRTKHSLDYLVRDCEKFALELQAAPGVAPPTKAEAGLEFPDGRRSMLVDDYPPGDALAIARQVFKSYSSMGAMRSARNIYVRQGREQRVFAIEELT